MKSQIIAGRLGLCIATLLCLLPGVLRAQIQIGGDNQNRTVTGTLTGDASVDAGGSITITNGFFTNGKNFRAFIKTGPSFCFPLAVNPNADQNYIRTFTPREAFTNANSLNGQDVCKVNQEIQYFDGLGRPLQTVIALGNPTATKDVIQPFIFDAFGRESMKYMPYTVQSTAPGTYRSEALSKNNDYNQSEQYGFHAASLGGVGTLHGFSQTVFEPSPLNRVEQQGFPGGDWQPAGTPGASNAGHTVKTEYGTNTATGDRAVRLYEANLTSTTAGEEHLRTLSSSKNYDANELYLTITKDENWTSGKSGTMEEYKDKEGRIVLKRTWENESTPLSTYYVYDDLGNLSFVLPPKSEPDNATPTTLDALCYQYRYDARQRLIEKKLPGKGWEWMVYNSIDQVVFSQDQNQRNRQEMSFMKYDGLGRVIMTGVEKGHTSTQQQITDLRNYLGGAPGGYQGALWETADINGTQGYTNNSIPGNLQNMTFYTVNYYDDYNIQGLPAKYNMSADPKISKMTKSLLTATKTAVLNEPTKMLWTVTYYTDKGRDTIMYTQHFKGGAHNNDNYDRVDNTYSFTSQLTQSIRKHYTTQDAQNPQLTIINEYNYDHMGRKIDSYEQINGQTKTLLARNEYNELGQLKTKKLHSENNGSNFMQSSNYVYNERGWLVYINDPASLTAQKSYGLQLYYNMHPNPALNQYNGNISAMVWQSKVPSGLGLMQQPQSTDYSYDRLNRLTLARYTTNGKVDQFNEGLSYDKAGDISSLERFKNGTKIDGLSYTYQNNNMSNRLQSVTDNSGNNEGQLNGQTNYVFDDNGNLKTDDKKGITMSEYNYLNLPQRITKSSTNETLTYVYDATGKKLRKLIGNQTRDYVNGIEYNNGTVEFIQTEEGRAIPSGQGFTYEYMLKDHLGNTRATLAGDGSIKQVQDYYAFGMEMNPNTSYTNTPNNQYKYNGKELQNELSLNQYDYGARFYDPVIGKMTTLDRFSEKYMGISPYQYGANNPISNIDMNGDSVIVSASITGNKVLNKAFNDFAGTKAGRKFLSNYAAKGQTINGYTFTTDGKYNDKGIDLNYGAKNLNDNTIGGYTDQSIGKNGRAEIDVTLNTQFSPLSNSFADETFNKSMTIAHESFIHADLDTKDFLDNRKFDNSNIDRSIVNTPGINHSHYQHIQVLNDYIKKGYYPGSSWPREGYNTMQEINNKNNAGRTPAQIMQKLWNYSGGVQLDLNGKAQ